MRWLVAVLAGLAAMVAACDRVVDLAALDAQRPPADAGSFDVIEDPIDTGPVDTGFIDSAGAPNTMDARPVDAGVVASDAAFD